MLTNTKGVQSFKITMYQDSDTLSHKYTLTRREIVVIIQIKLRTKRNFNLQCRCHHRHYPHNNLLDYTVTQNANRTYG
jgi:hypothetical protein